MLLILVVLVLAVFGVGRLASTMEPRQRVILIVVFVLGVGLLIFKLIDLGFLGRQASVG